jgi:hypothetical protein
MKRASITEDLAYGSALDRLTGGEERTPSKPPRATPRIRTKETAKPVRKTAPEPSPQIKLSVFLSRDEDSYLEGLSSSAKFSGGKKLSKTRLIEAMVQAFRSTRLDVRGVKTEEELRQRVNAQLRK